ncbi:MAG: SDR family oxidoreductase [Alicyclobacillus sp.]|nr:SDR family oxidoreductase [Alicyclobacillus sp.]
MKDSRTNGTRPTAIVTGASSGFGLRLAVALAGRGYRVAAALRDPARSAELLRLARDRGVEALVYPMRLDVSDENAAGPFVEQVVGQWGSVDVLVNNAGYAAGGFVEDVPMEAWHAQFATNFFGAVALTKAVLPHMRRAHRGAIVNISSIGGRVASPGMGPYVASKFALEGFTEALRMEVKPYGIRVVLVEPGAYRTDIWEKGLAQVPVPPESSPYSREMRVLMDGVRRTAASAADPDEVVRLVVRVLADPNPRLRYPVGRGVRAAVAAKSLLPWRLVEWLIANRFRRGG